MVHIGAWTVLADGTSVNRITAGSRSSWCRRTVDNRSPKGEFAAMESSGCLPSLAVVTVISLVVSMLVLAIL